MAVRLRYVDTDVSGGAGDGTSWANAYSSLNAAEQAEDDTGNINSSNEQMEFCCKGVTLADTAAVTFSGWTTSADDFIHVYPDASHYAQMPYSTTRYRLEVSTAAALSIAEEYVRITGLQIKTTTASNGRHAIYYVSIGASNQCIVNRCSLSGAVTGSANLVGGVAVNDADAIIKVTNCVFIDFKNSTQTIAGVLVQAATTTEVFNNTFHNCYYGVYEDGSGTGTITTTNCLFDNCTNDITGTNTDTYCGTTQTSGSGGLDTDGGANNVFSLTPSYDAGTDNFNLAAALAYGTSTSMPTDDFNGDTRSGTWDVGCDQYVSGVATLLVSVSDCIDSRVVFG